MVADAAEVFASKNIVSFLNGFPAWLLAAREVPTVTFPQSFESQDIHMILDPRLTL